MDATQQIEKHEFDFFPQEFAHYSDADMLRLVVSLCRLSLPLLLAACCLQHSNSHLQAESPQSDDGH